MKNICKFFALFLLICSCNSENVKYQEIVLKESILADAIPLTGDTLQLKREFSSADKMFLYNDSLVIVQNHNVDNNPFLEFYNYQKDTLIRQLLPCGKGPNEAIALSVNPTLDNGIFLTGDFAKQVEYKIDIDSILQNPKYEIQVIGKVPMSGVVTYALVGDSLISENPYEFSNKELGIDQTGSRFLIYDVNNADESKVPEFKYNTFSVAHCGQILVNKQKGRVLFAHRFFPIIEVYNQSLQLRKKIEGLIDLPIEYRVKNNRVSFGKKAPDAFTLGCSTPNYVYLYYVGAFWEDWHKEETDHNFYILKFDWDGNYIKTFRINSELTTLTCLNQSGKDVLFGNTNSDSDGKCYILKYENI